MTGLRVVAGSVGGRRLRVPPGEAVRPTSERVREAVANSLGSLGAVDGARVLDLFAGSGALGIELLSRGAAEAVFVEADPAVAAVLRENLEEVGFSDRAEVVVRRAEDFVAGADEAFDLALLDPPYAFSAWPELLERLPAGLAVIESGAGVQPPPGWGSVRRKAYGGTVVTVIRRQAGSGPASRAVSGPGSPAGSPTSRLR